MTKKKGKKKKSKSNMNGEMPTMGKSNAEYMAEDDLRTMKNAEMIKMDPKRMKGAMMMADKEMKAMSHIASLKDHIKKSKMKE